MPARRNRRIHSAILDATIHLSGWESVNPSHPKSLSESGATASLRHEVSGHDLSRAEKDTFKKNGFQPLRSVQYLQAKTLRQRAGMLSSVGK